MKTKILSLMLILATCIGFSACSESENKIAEQNIKQYVIGTLLDDVEIIEETYSKLYLFRPTNEQDLQTKFLKSIENESLGKTTYALSKYMTNSPSGIAIRLITSGCTRRVIEDIINNDIEFNSANYEVKEYAMIAFFLTSSTRTPKIIIE